MKPFIISLDRQGYRTKPKGEEISSISIRVGNNPMYVNSDNIQKVVEDIAVKGFAFAPTTFDDGLRRKEHFRQMQLLPLDFDGGISYEEVKSRAERYELPSLFDYETPSSQDRDKFRVCFLNNGSVTNAKGAEIMLQALHKIFPEADKSCRDIARMYFGGKNLLHFNESSPTINAESLLRNMTICLRDRHGTNYLRELRKFSDDTGVALTQNKLPDVSVEDDSPDAGKIAEVIGVNTDDISPSTFIYINGFGENSSNVKYRIKLLDGNTGDSAKTSRNHKEHRSAALKNIRSGCRLFREFEAGERRLPRTELFGLATNIIHVETGERWFKDTLRKHSHYAKYRQDYSYWEYNLDYMTRSGETGYCPKSCDGFCPYIGECSHGRNILSTSVVRYHRIEVLANREPAFVSLDEARQDTRRKIINAVEAGDDDKHIIKAQTSIGKSETYLDIMGDTSSNILVAASTNLLKNDLYERAMGKGTEPMVSPSLHEIKDGLPDEVWDKIQRFYDTGRYRSVHPYINKLIRENHRSAKLLKEYMGALDDFHSFNGSVITTHKRLLTMTDEKLDKFDNIIIDEDIIFKSIVTNHDTVSVSALEKLQSKIGAGNPLWGKIKEALKHAESKSVSLFTLSPIEWDDKEDGEAMPKVKFDITSFAGAEHFCVRRKSNEPNLKEDTVSFYKPVEFTKRKCVIVSATADETVCNYFFGKGNVQFHECEMAHYRGVLNQYYGKTMSRACIKKDPSVFEKIQKATGIDRTISFMTHELGPLWFGNTEGYDGWRGWDINVVGTPHFPDWIYKLFAYSIGLDFDEDAALETMLAEHNGCRFKFATFEDEVLRNIQFWMIETELEQAVGRARLLIEDCTVNLFSNFPLLQANLQPHLPFNK
jgi:hypothetical protein